MTEATHQTWPANAWLLQISDLRVDMRYRRLIRPDQTVELPQRTFDLLVLFLREPHVLHARADLFQRVWPGVIVEDANLSQAVWVLRKALGPERKDWIRTVAKGGYVFEPPARVIAMEEAPASAPAYVASPSPVEAPGDSSNEACSSSRAGADAALGALSAPMAPNRAAPEAAATPASPSPSPLRRWWMAAAGLCLVSLAAAASWFGNQPTHRTEPFLNVLLIEVQGATEEGANDHWRTTVLHAWLAWKLRALPNVNVLREENLAVEASPAQPKVVLLATGASPERDGDIYVRASFAGPAGNESVQVKGPADQLSRLVDDVSRQVMQRLMPGRVRDAWPALDLDLTSARRFADAFTATERRDWRAARVAAQDVIQRSPHFAAARLQLAIALGRLGQAGLAIEQFSMVRATLKPLPEDAAKVLDALQLAADPRRLTEAAAASGALAQAYPQRRGFLLDQATLLARIGEVEQARNVLTQPDWQQQAVGMRIPQLLALADLHLQLGDPQQARVHARLAEKLATNAGSGWQIEHAMALAIEAESNVVQYEGKADLTLFERAAREFEAAGDEIDALFMRFLAESAQPAGRRGITPRMEQLLLRARAGGYRRLEIDILRRVAFQQYIAGNMAEYRSLLSQALTVANAAGDTVAQQLLDLDLLNEDMAVGDFGSAEQRVKRLRDSGLRGDRAFWVAQFDAQLVFLRGRYDAALKALDRVALGHRQEGTPLPPIPRARLACSQADVLLVQGHTARARHLYLTCGKVDHALTRLMADLGTVMADAASLHNGADPAALEATLSKIKALPDGPDRWWPAVAIATVLTRTGRAGDVDKAETIYRSVAPGAAHARYAHLTRMVELGLAEVAAARGDWTTSRKHAHLARANLPPGDWFLSSRLAKLDVGENLARGNREAALRQLARLDAHAHALGDVIVQQEVHSLMPPEVVVGKCTEGTRAALARKSALHGSTLAWMSPRADPPGSSIKVVNNRRAR